MILSAIKLVPNIISVMFSNSIVYLKNIKDAITVIIPIKKTAFFFFGRFSYLKISRPTKKTTRSSPKRNILTNCPATK